MHSRIKIINMVQLQREHLIKQWNKKYEVKIPKRTSTETQMNKLQEQKGLEGKKEKERKG